MADDEGKKPPAPPARKVKRYKLYLEPDFHTSQISKKTNERWARRKNLTLHDNKSCISTEDVGPSTSSMSVVEVESDNQHKKADFKAGGRTAMLQTSSSKFEAGNPSLAADVQKDVANYGLCHRSDSIDLEDDDLDDDQFSDYESCMGDSNIEENDSESDNLENDEFSETEDFKKEEGMGFSKLVDFGKKIMFNEAGICVSDVIFMILGFCLRFSLSYVARNALVDLVKCLAGPRFETWSFSKYMFSKLCDAPDYVVTYNFFCTSCSEGLLPAITKNKFKKTSAACNKCGRVYELSLESKNYFIGINLEYQIKLLLTNVDVKKALLDYMSVIRKNVFDGSNLIRDVYDGQLYKDIAQLILSDVTSCIITLSFNTDGAPIWRSSKKSFWPLQCFINELPPEIRFKYSILCALSIGECEPSPAQMQCYMQKFVQESQHLVTEGFKLQDVENRDIAVKVVPLLCSVDSVARPVIQNRIQYSGFYGCSWCYIHGKYEANCVRYPSLKEEEDDLRTHESHITDVDNVLKNKGMKIRGVKGDSSLMKLVFFNMVWGFPLDYMHGVLLGVVKYIFDIWSNSKSSWHFTPEQRRKLNQIIVRITPTHEIHRLPRSFADKAKWKASEWRAWLLFYCLPCLENILPNTESRTDPKTGINIIDHMSLLVRTIVSLLGNAISEAELEQCEYDMIKFVGEYELLYGIDCMTFNVHILLHLADSVRMSGPLWATSAFPYENEIFYLKKQVTGPRGIYSQIASRILHRNSYKVQMEQTAKSESCLQFCKTLFSKLQCTFSAERVEVTADTDVVLLGPRTSATIYHRCIYKGQLFSSTQYTRSKTTNDTMVKLKSGQIAAIQSFVLTDHTVNVKIELMDITNGNNCSFSVHQMQKIRISGKQKIVSIKEILHKLLRIEVEGTVYVATLTNNVEVS